ncbi:MAG: DUF3347 domain-containing protein [Chitinophagaceae bacterium]|nr:DUF3347 domain-containing protein [Chitinophagaceae bacterium]
MKRVIGLVAMIAIIVFGFWLYFEKTYKGASEEKEKADPVQVLKHSEVFNSQVDQALYAYMDMKDALVEADSVSAKDKAAAFGSAMGNIQLDELKEDEAEIKSGAEHLIAQIQQAVTSIGSKENLEGMRRDFKDISDNMYPLLKTIGYEGKKLYWDLCPMAFGEEAANWLSFSSDIVNPYLGKKHPVFKSGMLNCGEVVDSLSQ